MRMILTLLWMLLAVCTHAVNGFHTQRLENMARALGKTVISSTDTLLAFGKRVRVKANALGDISHIGYRLFNDEIVRSRRDAPVFDFVERYLLELDMQLDGRTPQVRMEHDQVVLGTGTLRLLRAVDTSTPFSIEEVTRRMYRIQWTVNGQPVSLTFPADYQLIKGANAVELEQMMQRDLLRTVPQPVNNFTAPGNTAGGTRSDSMMIINSGQFLSSMIRSDIYLTEIPGKQQLYCSRKNVSASISNIMLTGQFRDIIPLHLCIDKYAHKRDEVDITLQQFVAYCTNEGCKLYFGTKTIDHDNLSGTLFAYNEKMAYCHVLSVQVPLALIDGAAVGMTGMVYAYIPLQNVTEKFFSQSVRKPAKNQE